MNRYSFITFFLEFMIFVGLLFVYTSFWGLSYESHIFLILIFLFSWFYHYIRSIILLQYYTHVFMVSIYFLAISCISALILKHTHILVVSFLVGLSWFTMIVTLRSILINLFFKPYRIFIHPVLLPLVVDSKKVNLIAKEKVSPEVMKSIEAIIIERKFDYDENWQNLIIHATRYDIPMLTITQYNELIQQRLTLEQLKENWMYAGFNIPLWYFWLRNILEFLFVLLLLPFLLCLFSTIGVIILLTMGKPIFYSQERIGRNGKAFKIYKFRSMMKNSEQDGAQFTVKDDLRVTRFGAFMRRFRIDELPQFFNILKGDMSLIGPRPEQKIFVEKFNEKIPLYKLRHLVRPGITGWAQVMSGYAENEDETRVKLQYDLYYVKHFSFIMDFKIILKTVYTILTGFRAR